MLCDFTTKIARSSLCTSPQLLCPPLCLRHLPNSSGASLRNISTPTVQKMPATSSRMHPEVVEFDQEGAACVCDKADNNSCYNNNNC